jgi:acyl-CoA reductase-like NAD-dependent aldehyde dehydrogenase
MTTTEVATVVTRNPSNGCQLASYPVHSDDEVDQAIGDVCTAAEQWGRTATVDRAAVFARLAVELEAAAPNSPS